MFQEITKLSFQASRLQEPLLTYQNSVLAMRVDKGIQLYEFTYKLESLEKNLDLKSTWIQNPTSSPAVGLFPREFLNNEIKNVDMTEMMLDPGLWPHNPVLLQENSMIVAMEWSPVGIVHSHQCVLAVLNNVGNVQFYGQKRFGWENVLDLSSVIKQQYVSSKTFHVPKNLRAIKELVYSVETSAIAWGPKLYKESCYFTNAQKNGDIIFWSIHNNDDIVSAQLIGTVPTDFGEIIGLLWVPKSENNHILICSNTLGQIFSYEIVFTKDKLEIIQTTCLWKHKDKMIPKFLLHTIVEDKIIFVCNKHRHLLVQALDKSCNILSEVINNVNDFRISDIKNSEDGLYFMTTNFKLYKIKLNFVNSNLTVNLALIETKDQYSNYEFYSFSYVSESLIILALVDQRLQSKKHVEKIDLVFLTSDIEHKSEMQALLENPSRKLTYCWPYIELIRVKTLKLKVLPQADYAKLYCNVANDDLYDLKLYLVLAVLYNRIDSIARNKLRGVLPETSIDVVKEKIQSLHASKVISELSEIQIINGVLDDFDQEILLGSLKFLEFYCKKYNKQINEFVSVRSLPKTDLQYNCQCCEEKIEGFKCKNDHMNMFCALTFTPIESDDYLVCKRCSSTYRIELYRINSMCLFCDLHLNYFSSPS